MPRGNSARSAVKVAPEAITAAVVQVGAGAGSVPGFQSRTKPWQLEAWDFFDENGELSYAANYLGNALSRCLLVALSRALDGTVGEASRLGKQLLESLHGGHVGQPEMLRAFGINLTVAGECYLVGWQKEGIDAWNVVGITEMKPLGRSWQMRHPDNDQVWVDLSEAFILRVWRPDPRRPSAAWSPVKPSLPTLREIRQIGARINAEINSRLAGAGILWIPQGVQLPPPPASMQLSPDAGMADQFMATLGAGMIAPIADPSDPASLVPLVAVVPDELVGKPEWMEFWSELNEHQIPMRDQAIRRFAVTMDLPVEIILGAAESAHGWGAWQIDESAIKLHIEPLLTIIASCLTIGYIRPAGGNELDYVGYDTAPIRLRPDHSKESIELWDRGLLSAAAVVRENGFNPEDAMDEKERQTWLLLQLAKGQGTPEMVLGAHRGLGSKLVPVELPDPTTDRPANDAIREARPTPSLEDHPANDLPVRASAAKPHPTHPLIAAAEMLVFRALERAGNRLSNYLTADRQESFANVAPHQRYLLAQAPTDGRLAKMLEGAWTVVPETLSEYGDPDRIANALDGYTRELLISREQPSRGKLAEYLTHELAPEMESA